MVDLLQKNWKLEDENKKLRESLKEVHIENKKLKKENNVYKLLEITQPLLKLGIPITEQKLSRKNPQLVKRRLQVKQMQRGLIRRNKEIEKLREGLLQIYNLKDVVDDKIVKHTSNYAKRVLNSEKVDTKK